MCLGEGVEIFFWEKNSFALRTVVQSHALGRGLYRQGSKSLVSWWHLQGIRVSIAKCLDNGMRECFLLVLLGMCIRGTLWITFRWRSKKMYPWAHSAHNKCEMEGGRGKERERLFRRKFRNGKRLPAQNFAWVISFLSGLICQTNMIFYFWYFTFLRVGRCAWFCESFIYGIVNLPKEKLMGDDSCD